MDSRMAELAKIVISKKIDFSTNFYFFLILKVVLTKFIN